MRSFPLITAHTGCMETLDNTLASAARGIQLGADIIEEDIRVTRDGVAVLAHDDIWRTVNGTELRISEMNYAELRGQEIIMDHGDNSGTITIRTLEELFQLVEPHNPIINLDLKVDEAIAAAARLVNQYNLLDRVFLSGCEADRAMLAQQSHPQLSKLLNASSELFLSQPYEQAVQQTLNDATKASCFGVNIYHEFLAPRLLEQAEASGLSVYVWTVNEIEWMEHYASLGVASITTRRVDKLVQVKNNFQTTLDA
jgi:glycerophosphoryl diester phosphodiesterase